MKHSLVILLDNGDLKKIINAKNLALVCKYNRTQLEMLDVVDY